MSAARADEWLSIAISDIAVFGSGDMISVARLSARSGSNPIPVYGGNGVAGYTSLAMVDRSTVILGRVGQKCGVVFRNAGPAWITDNALYAHKFKRPLDIQFLAYALEAARLNDVKNRNDLPLITQSILNDVKIAWPDSLEEQRQIAGAMADVDDLIASLERWIAKKQAIQQGMMQQLLTGKTRLPGFAAPWREVRLRDVGATYGGLTGKAKEDFDTGSAQFVTFTEVMASPRLLGHGLGHVKVRPGERQNAVLCGDILFNGSSETPEEVALAAVVDFDPSPNTFLNSFCFGYRLKGIDRIDPAYLAYFFRSDGGRALVAALAQGSTRYNIAKTKLLDVSPVLPSVDEQRAIVAILRDAEDEIATAKRRLIKARAKKTGMMQELPTGRTRLPVRKSVA